MSIFLSSDTVTCQNGYKLINIPSNKNDYDQAVLIEGDYPKLIPLKKDLRKVYLEVTTKCNFDCVTCIRNSWQEEIGHMKMHVFSSLIESFTNLPNLRTVHLGGFGEPLTHPDILRMIDILKCHGLRVEIITNGALLTPETSRALFEMGVDTIFVSIDSTEAINYKSIRKGGDYNQVINNICELNKLRTNTSPLLPELGIEFVAMRSNYQHLPNLMKLAGSLKARRVLISNVLPYHESLVNETLYDMDDQAFPFGLETSYAYVANMKLRSFRNCKFVENNSASINWEGEVAPCYALMHSYKCYIYGREKFIKAHSFGNISHENLAAIWTKPQYAVFRHRVKDNKFPSCTDCKWQEGCSYTQDNEADCWCNEPSCADCLWYREMIICP